MLESTPKAHESILGSAGALAITNFYGMPSLVTGLPRRSRGEGGSLLNPAAPFEQPRRFHPIRPGREGRRRAAPAQRLGIVEERRIGAQGREILEEQREIAPFAENVWREVFDRTVTVHRVKGFAHAVD